MPGVPLAVSGLRVATVAVRAYDHSAEGVGEFKVYSVKSADAIYYLVGIGPGQMAAGGRAPATH